MLYSTLKSILHWKLLGSGIVPPKALASPAHRTTACSVSALSTHGPIALGHRLRLLIAGLPVDPRTVRWRVERYQSFRLNARHTQNVSGSDDPRQTIIVTQSGISAVQHRSDALAPGRR